MISQSAQTPSKALILQRRPPIVLQIPRPLGTASNIRGKIGIDLSGRKGFEFRGLPPHRDPLLGRAVKNSRPLTDLSSYRATPEFFGKETRKLANVHSSRSTFPSTSAIEPVLQLASGIRSKIESSLPVDISSSGRLVKENLSAFFSSLALPSTPSFPMMSEPMPLSSLHRYRAKMHSTGELTAIPWERSRQSRKNDSTDNGFAQLGSLLRVFVQKVLEPILHWALEGLK